MTRHDPPDPKRHGRHRRRLLAVLLAGTAVLAACSDDDASSGDGGVAVAAVPSDMVERFIEASITLPPSEEGTVAPGTCVEDEDSTWFLPTFIAPGASEVTCAVPSGARLMVNSGGFLCADNEGMAADELVESCESDLADFPSVQAVIVDGVEVAEQGAATTGMFTLELGDENLFGAPAGPMNIVYSGRNALLSGLSDGEHTIRLMVRTEPGEDIEQYDVDLTYRITVG
jgi:hypothetical protein